MLPLALAVLGASLLGSVHCAAMCGAFACFAAGRDSRRLADHAPYHAGRLASYLVLGALAGGLGHGLDRAGRLAGVSDLAVVAMALLLIGWGAATLVGALGTGAIRVRIPAWWQRRIGAILARLERRGRTMRGLVTGALTGLLPCGWLWAFVAIAAGTGNPLQGMAVMALLWLGAVPALVAVAAGLARLTGPWQRRLPAASAMLVMLLGLVALAAHLEWLPVGSWLHRLVPMPGGGMHGGMHG